MWEHFIFAHAAYLMSKSLAHHIEGGVDHMAFMPKDEEGQKGLEQEVGNQRAL